MFGIDQISFYVPNYYLDVGLLSQADNTLGQKKMNICPPDEDIVSMAANASLRIVSKLSEDELNNIELLLFATESGIDFSKSAGTYVHRLLNLPNRCRVLELKQACYAGTAGLQLALTYLTQNPTKKALVIASDVARYSLNTSAESSQGAGAVAMLLSANPRVLVLEPESGFYSEEVMDFWRPNYAREAFVNGKYSCEVYLDVLGKCWNDYSKLSGRNFNDHDYFCYHTPVPKLAEIAHRRLAKINGIKLTTGIDLALEYGREVGNCYTASLYIGIISLLEHSIDDLSNKRIGLYSYGSGCTGEYFCVKILPNYQASLFTLEHKSMLNNRKSLSYSEYLEFYNFKLPEDGSNYSVPVYEKTGKFHLVGINMHQRIYAN